MNSAFILHHSYEMDGYDQTKLIGLYTSHAEAEQAIERLKDQPGFRDYLDAFSIEEYELNKDHWIEGFATITTLLVKDIEDNWKPVVGTVLKEGYYEIVERYENHLLG